MIGLVVAGLASGVGKTTLTLGLIGALRKRGLIVQPFKVGPDYIDPSQHAQAAGRPSRNLDSWLLPEPALRELFRRAAATADAAIVEGVMGLFDGRSGAGEIGSTAHVAKALGLPVLLVVDAAKAGRSVAAGVLGCRALDPDLRIAGVILNNVAGERHAELGREAVEAATGLPVLGWLPREPALHQEERYLGLVPAAERQLPDDLLGRVTALVEAQIDLNRLIDLDRLVRTTELRPAPLGPTSPPDGRPSPPYLGPLRSPRPPSPLSPHLSRDPSATRAPGVTRERGERPAADGVALVGETLTARSAAPLFPVEPVAPRVRIAVAQDRAFSFYYQDSLDLLAAWGAELVPFSPLADTALPDGTDGVYLGGGFPELFAAELAANQPMLAAIRAAAEAGLPIYGECGGLMYLQQHLTDRDGRAHLMAGLIPGTSTLVGSRLTLGYRELRARRATLLLQPGETARGHEFHWSVSEPPPSDLAAYDVLTDAGRGEGFAVGSVLASYVHLHFGSDARLSPRFVAACTRDRSAACDGRRPAARPAPPLPLPLGEGWGEGSAGDPRHRSERSLDAARRLAPLGMTGGEPQAPHACEDDGQQWIGWHPAGHPANERRHGSGGDTGQTAPGPLLRRHGLPPAQIEMLSRQRIEARLGAHLPPDEPARSLAARLVYAAGDPDLADRITISEGVITAAVGALRRGAPLVVDVGMVATGIARAPLATLAVELLTAVQVDEAGPLADRLGITRAAAGLLTLADRLDGAVVAIGNAPTALLALLDLAASGRARPAAVIGVPVGFVAAEESKEHLLASGLPCVTVRGTRGGSALAVAAVNVLLRLATDVSFATPAAEAHP